MRWTSYVFASSSPRFTVSRLARVVVRRRATPRSRAPRARVAPEDSEDSEDSETSHQLVRARICGDARASVPRRRATRRDATTHLFIRVRSRECRASRRRARDSRERSREASISRRRPRRARLALPRRATRARRRVATSRDAARKFSRRRRRRGRTRVASRARRRVARRVRIDVSSRRASTRTTVVSTLFAHRLRNVKRIDNRVDRDVARPALDDARDCPTRDVRDVRESSVGTKVRRVVARLFSSRRTPR